MTPMQIFFLVTAAFTLFAAGMVVTANKLMHSALWLVVALFGVAVTFALLDASFFAVVQVLVYIGAIAILVIFAVMLTHRMMNDTISQMNKGWWLPLVGALLLFVGLSAAAVSFQGAQTLLPVLPAGGENLPSLGQGLVASNGYVIPFEVASVLLLAALVGAIYLGMEEDGGRKIL
jgi:NADH-quinone oxidoreductase subunit J